MSEQKFLPGDRVLLHDEPDQQKTMITRMWRGEAYIDDGDEETRYPLSGMTLLSRPVYAEPGQVVIALSTVELAELTALSTEAALGDWDAPGSMEYGKWVSEGWICADGKRLFSAEDADPGDEIFAARCVNFVRDLLDRVREAQQ